MSLPVRPDQHALGGSENFPKIEKRKSGQTLGVF